MSSKNLPAITRLQPLWLDADPMVQGISAEMCYQAVRYIHDMGNLPTSSLDGFDDPYFYQAVIHVWLLQKKYRLDPKSKFPYPCTQINGVNWPAGDLTGKSELLRGFLERVKSDSVPAGDPFDVSFAAAIIDMAFNEAGDLRHPEPRIQEFTDEGWERGWHDDPPKQTDNDANGTKENGQSSN